MGHAGLGLHLPDRDVLMPDEIDAVLDLRPSVLLAMAYEADKGLAEQVNALVAELGHQELLVRPWAHAIPELEPARWAEACAERLARYRAPRLHCLPANEWNLQAEGGHEEYDRHARWFGDFAAAYRALRPDDLLHLPAPWAGWVGEDERRAVEAWEALMAAGVVARYDEVDAHCYGAGLDLWRRCRDLLGRRPWVTEWNQCSIDGVVAALAEPEGPRGAIYFTLRWVSYEEGKEWRDDDVMSLLRYPRLYERFRAARAAQQEERSRPMTVDDLHRIRWQLARADFAPEPGEFHPDWGIEQFWRKNPQIGSPVSGEVPLDDGSVGRVFTNAVVVWKGGRCEIAS